MKIFNAIGLTTGLALFGFFYGFTMAQNPLPPLLVLRDDPIFVLPVLGALLIIMATVRRG